MKWGEERERGELRTKREGKKEGRKLGEEHTKDQRGREEWE